MAPTMLQNLTDWYSDRGEDYLELAAKVSLVILWHLVGSVLVFLVVTHVLLFVRALKMAYGKRVEPDGGRAIIITGATSGFGLATTKRLYKLGFTVFACYYNDQESGYAELLDLKLKPFGEVATGPRAKAGAKAGAAAAAASGAADFQRPSLFLIKMDVRSEASIGRAGDEIRHLLDVHQMKLHCLLNNAGTSTDGAFELSTKQSIRNMLETNLVGVMQVTKEFILRLITDRGRVVNVSSGVYHFPAMEYSIYGATKAAVAYFSDCLHQDLKAYDGATCHTIVPGNFVLHSNIVFTKIHHLQRSIAQLSDQERVAYAKTIDRTNRLADRMLRARLTSTIGQGGTREDPKQIAQIYKLQLPTEFDTPPTPGARPAAAGPELRELKSLSLWQRFHLFVVSRSDGSTPAGVSLDESRVLEGFEDAVRLVGAPRRIYAGNWWFSNIAGPILQYFPPALTAILGRSVAINLVKGGS